MALKPGSWLGHYEILEHIGSGGMGEVYRARDNKLQREVALKVLPEQFARDPERVARFRREAQLLAQLNHPNIAAIHSVEEAEGRHFLVMELVPGETLKERSQKPGARSQNKGGIPLSEALDICKQIADALEHAHEKPIIHRDLKPANVKVTPAGVVKVLDFGLAKAFAKAGEPVNPMDVPTGTQHDTLKGTILGTPAYMSPEQAAGKETDKRTDIWALGCVLYELLTGKRAFEGETVTEIIASVLKSEPDWSALPAETPATIRSLLRRCLQKDAKRRSRDATEIQLQIEDAQTSSVTTLPATVSVAAPRRVSRQVVMAGLACLLLGGLIAGLAIWSLRPAPPQLISRFALTLGPTQRLTGVGRHLVALSPSGTHLVYAADEQLYLRAMDELESTPMRGTEGGRSPFFSPDGQWVGFWAGGMLKKVSISGGSPVTLCEADNPYGANWGTDDIIVFGQGARGLWQVPGAGGTKQPLVTGDSLAGVFGHGPQILPGGKVVLFTLTRTRNWNDAQIVVQDLETGERRVLVEGGTDARYLPTGQLVYVRDGTLLAVPFDLKRLAVAGGPVPIVEGIAQSPGQTGAAHFSLSSSGSLVYVPGNTGPPNSTLVWVDRQGTIKPLEAPARQYRDPRLSPDGQRLALRIIGDSTDIWVYDITRLTLTRLTFEGINQHPVWTPDGSRVAFRSTRREQSNLFWKPADGSGQAERLTTGQQVQSPSSWSPDGQLLAFFERSPAEPAGDSGNYDIWVLPLAGDRKPRPFLQTPFGEGEAVFSPDGRWLAYVSNESGRQEIFVQPFPGPGGKWQISTGGGIEPVWARSGRELFYRNGDQMMTVDTTTQPSFRAGAPRLLFEGNFLTGTAFRANYDVTPDGQRFVMVQQGEGVSGVSQIHVVLNWFEELKRRVPAGR